MTNTSRYTFLAGMILTLGPTLEAHPPDSIIEPKLGVQIRVYNYSHVPEHVLKRAQQEVTHILGEAGVETRWVPCALTLEELDNFPQCNTRRRRTVLVVAILPREMAKKLTGAHDVFGVAASSRTGSAFRASIFSHRVEEYAGEWQASSSLLLGHFIAHEIGHLLLGANSHSRSGIMHVPWTKL